MKKLEEVQIEYMDISIPFAKAQANSLNTGVKNVDGSRKSSTYVGYVGNHLYAEVAKFLCRAIACSFVSANDTFGGSHEFQVDLISAQKLNMLYKEIRVLLGYLPNSRTMMVEISPCRREKIVKFILEESLLLPEKKTSIRDIARILYLLQSI